MADPASPNPVDMGQPSSDPCVSLTVLWLLWLFLRVVLMYCSLFFS